MCNHRLDDDDGGIDNHTKVYGAQRHQVAVDAEGLHHAEGKEHTERDDTRHHQSCTPVAQEDDKHEDDDKSTFDEVAGDGALYSIHQVGTVDKRFDDHTFGQ